MKKLTFSTELWNVNRNPTSHLCEKERPRDWLLPSSLVGHLLFALCGFWLSLLRCPRTIDESGTVVCCEGPKDAQSVWGKEGRLKKYTSQNTSCSVEMSLNKRRENEAVQISVLNQRSLKHLHIVENNVLPNREVFSPLVKILRHLSRKTELGSLMLLVSMPNAQQAITSRVNFWKSLQLQKDTARVHSKSGKLMFILFVKFVKARENMQSDTGTREYWMAFLPCNAPQTSPTDFRCSCWWAVTSENSSQTDWSWTPVCFLGCVIEHPCVPKVYFQFNAMYPMHPVCHNARPFTASCRTPANISLQCVTPVPMPDLPSTLFPCFWSWSLDDRASEFMHNQQFTCFILRALKLGLPMALSLFHWWRSSASNTFLYGPCRVASNFCKTDASLFAVVSRWICWNSRPLTKISFPRMLPPNVTWLWKHACVGAVLCHESWPNLTALYSVVLVTSLPLKKLAKW